MSSAKSVNFPLISCDILLHLTEVIFVYVGVDFGPIRY